MNDKRLNAFLMLMMWQLCTAFCMADDRYNDAKELVLNDVDWPPYLIPGENALLPGIGKEVLLTCLDNDKVQLKYLNLPVKRTEVYLRSGVLDLTLYSYKVAREAFIYYGKEPIFITEYGFAVARERNVEVHSLDDLQPYTIGHLGGLSHTPELLSIIQNKVPLHEVVESYDIDIMLNQLISVPPRVDIIPNSKSTFFWRAKELGLEKEIRVLDYTVAQKAYYLTVSKASKNIAEPEIFLQNMDDCFRRMKADGRYQEILAKYGFE